MLANLPVPAGHDANTPVRGEGPGGADAAAHPRLSSRANRGVASQQAAALARPPEQGDASGEERASRSRGPGFSVGRGSKARLDRVRTFASAAVSRRVAPRDARSSKAGASV